MVRQYTLTMTGSAQNLKTALAAAGDGDTPLKFLSIQPYGANAAASYIGGDNGTISATNYGVRLEAGAAGVPPAPFIIEVGVPPVRLSDINVIGANTEKLAILTIT